MHFLVVFFFLPDSILQFIVNQTNLFAQQYIDSNPSSFYPRPYEWRCLTLEEFRLFMGLTLNMRLTKKKMKEMTTDPPTPSIYSSIMPRSRYEMIMQFLHFSDNTQCPPWDNANYDKLYKICPLIKKKIPKDLLNFMSLI